MINVMMASDGLIKVVKYDIFLDESNKIQNKIIKEVDALGLHEVELVLELMGVPNSEAQIGIEELRNGYNLSHFGMRGNYIYSINKEEML